PSALAGIEISPGPLETARQLIPPPGLPMNLKLETYDGKTFPSWVGDYTQVSLIDVLHHVSPQAQQPFLAALFESMGPGAELLLKDIDAGRRILVWVNRLHDRLLSGEMGRELSASACLELLRAAGFECSPVHSRRMLLYPHFTIVARKPQKKGADPA
ncbi:MAG: class I SAM-dependent methyltransferase, partial [Deltaproteobacteria bacterium]|nr:class I SAM-dependent methyltransferase [Deltaproteobacteria bacterium]